MNTWYRATVEAKVPQVVTCEYCEKEFLYFMRKTGVGAASVEFFNDAAAKRRAEMLARRKLMKQLTPQNCNPVPCLYCFRFQTHMRKEAGEERYGRNRPIGWIIALFGGVVLFIGGLSVSLKVGTGTDYLVALMPGLFLLLLGGLAYWRVAWLVAHYDPNTLPAEERERIAAERCTSWEQFMRLQAERIARRYRRHVEDQKREKWRSKAEDRSPPPPVRIWLPPAAFTSGLSVPVRLSPSEKVMIEVTPETKPGKIIELVPAGRNELPFCVSLMDIFDYHRDMPEDEDEE